MKKTWIILGLFAALFALGFGVQDAAAQGGVAGVVLDVDGAAVPGAQVTIMGMMQNRHERPYHAQTNTDDNGAFGFQDVPAGRYQISAMSRQAGMGRVAAEVHDAEVTNVVIRLAGRGGGGGGGGEGETVTVTVTDQDGNPIEGAVVHLMGRMGHRGGRHFRGAQARTNADGIAVFENVPAGNYVVGARARGYGGARARLTVGPDEENAVTLQLHRRR